MSPFGSPRHDAGVCPARYPSVVSARTDTCVACRDVMEAQVFPLGFGRRPLWSFKMDSIKNTTEETIVNIKKTGWVKFFAAAAVLGFMFCGAGLRAAAADPQGENKIIVITTNTITPYS